MSDKMKLCPVCKMEFLPKHGNQRYCSPECLRKVKSDYSRKYYAEHRESIRKRKREYQRVYYRKHRESLLEQRNRRSLCIKRHGNCFSCPYEDCIMQ